MKKNMNKIGLIDLFRSVNLKKIMRYYKMIKKSKCNNYVIADLMNFNEAAQSTLNLPQKLIKMI